MSQPYKIWDLSEGETAAREETKGLLRGAAGTAVAREKFWVER